MSDLPYNHDDLENQRELLELDYAKLEAKCDELEKINAAWARRVTELEGEVAARDEQITLLLATNDKWVVEIERWQAKAEALHGQIMNLEPAISVMRTKDLWSNGYRIGHRDARHAAAELVVGMGFNQARISQDERKP